MNVDVALSATDDLPSAGSSKLNSGSDASRFFCCRLAMSSRNLSASITFVPKADSADSFSAVTLSPSALIFVRRPNTPLVA